MSSDDRNRVRNCQSSGEVCFSAEPYFLSMPALKWLAELNIFAGEFFLSVVPKAKSCCAAYEKPEPREPGKHGRPSKKVEKSSSIVRLPIKWGTSAWEKEFTKAKVWMYGKYQSVEYLVQGLYQEFRFFLMVMVRTGLRSILVSTDLSLDPVQILELYGRRFSFESYFRGLKQQFGWFYYHFWIRSALKLNHFKKKNPDPLETVRDEECMEKVLKPIG